MGKKGNVDNPDYFKSPVQARSRKVFAKAKAKVAREPGVPGLAGGMKGKKGAATPVVSGPAPGHAGAGVETLQRLRKRQKAQAQREEAQAQREEELEQTERILAAQVPVPAPARSLPAASRETILRDLLRGVRENAATARRAAVELYGSVGELARSPLRLVRALWVGGGTRSSLWERVRKADLHA